MTKSVKALLPLMGAMLLGAPAAWAQEGSQASAEDRPAMLDNVVVTAQRREQSLQDVPISVKAFTRDDIDRFDITEFSDYAILTPNVGFAEQDSQGQGAITIRGIGPVGGEQSVFGTYLDGFELPNVTGRVYDLERIEVLRGPQGTTFGRNIIAGALNLTSVTPSFDGVSGYVSAEAGNFGLFDFEGGVTLPISDTIAIRAAAFYNETDGWLENQIPGTESNFVETFGGRLTVAAAPNDRLNMKAIVSYESYDQGLGNSLLTDGVLLEQVQGLQGIIDAGLNPFFEPGAFPAGPDRFFPDQTTEVFIDAPSFTEFQNLLALGRFDYDFGPVTLVGIAGVAQIDYEDSQDLDYSELDLGVWERDRNTTFYSAEVRLESNGNEKLNWVVGAYYSRNSEEEDESQTSGADMEAITFVPGVPFTILPNNTFLFGGFSTDEVDTYAIYGEADYALTDRLNILAGLRYTRLEFFESLVDGATFDERFPGAGLPFLLPQVIPDDEGSVDSDRVTWRTSLVYQASDDVNLYASVSTGFRGGGLQLNNVERSDFDSDSVINYEIGTKAFFFDRRAAVNLSAFFMDWEDIQIEVRNRANNNRFTDNAGRAEIYGFELDFQVIPLEGLTFSGGVGYANSELTEFDDPQDVRLGTPLPWSPQWRVNLVGDYKRTLFGDIEGFVRAIYIYNGEVQAGLPEEGTLGVRILDDWNRFDLRFGLERPDDWRIEGYIENVTNEVYAVGGWFSGFSLSGRQTIVSPQRYGVRLRKTF